MDRLSSTLAWYKEKKELYARFSKMVLSKIQMALDERNIIIAYSSAREKSIESLHEKCQRTIYDKNEEKYVYKYNDPRNQITDFAGVRIVTYLKSDISSIRNVVEAIFSIDIENSVDKLMLMHENEVGYLSMHYIVSLKGTSFEENAYAGLKCEVQIRTLLQDAWAQIFHDRYYKSNVDLIEMTPELKRRTNLIAGNLELLDDQINNLVFQYDKFSTSPISNEQLQKLLDSNIDEETLLMYCRLKFKGGVSRYYNAKLTLSKLAKFDMNFIRDINNVLHEDLVKLISQMNQMTVDKLVDYLLIIKDANKYFSHYDGQSIKVTKESFEFLNSFVDMEKIRKDYGVAILD